MDQDRRTMLRRLAAIFVGGFLVRGELPDAQAQEVARNQSLQELLQGVWNLRSYTYTTNNRTYSSPDEMEATVDFDGSTYSVEFTTHIRAVGVQRTRRASESGTFSVEGNRILLDAKEASSEAELGEEVLSEIQIEDDMMSLVSNNGINQEVWGRTSPLTRASWI